MIKLVLVNTTGDNQVASAVWNRIAQAGDFNALAEDRTYYDVDTTGTARTATLPASNLASTGMILGFKRLGNRTLTIASSSLIDGASTVVMTVNNAYLEVLWNGSTWEIK